MVLVPLSGIFYIFGNLCFVFMRAGSVEVSVLDIGCGFVVRWID